jgi:hypothetical protein
MVGTLLQDMVEGRPYESLPANWSSFDLKSFSRQKQLWDYQQKAVAWAVAGLWKYYEDFGDYQRGESLDVNLERKRRGMRDSHPSGYRKRVKNAVRAMPTKA